MIKLPHRNAFLWWPIIIVALIVIGVMVYSLRSPKLIPESIKKQVSFDILTPDSSNSKSNWSIDSSSIKYDNKQGILSYIAKMNNQSITVTEQNTPDSFSDIPQLYPTLLNKLHQYADIQTSKGTVTLTHPVELNGGQTAVSNNHGTLIFARPSSNLTNQQWTDFFNSLTVIK